MSSNPLNIENLFNQLEADIQKRMDARSGDVAGGSYAHIELRIDSYSRIIQAHPENTHDNTHITSTEVLLRKIETCIEVVRVNSVRNTTKEGHALAVKAFTRIIAGRN